MNCGQAREMLEARRADPELAQHLDDCEDCRRLATLLALAADLPEAELPPGFETRLRARLAEVARPRRRTWTYAVPAAALAMVVAIALVVRQPDGRAPAAAPAARPAAGAAAGPNHPAEPPRAFSGADDRTAPQAQALARPRFEPSSVAFWNDQLGLLGGAESCPDHCAGVLETTRDGGRTWAVAYRGGARVSSVAVAADSTGWATASTCAYVGEQACKLTLLRTDDGGRSWRAVGGDVADPSFATADAGWALPSEPPVPGQPSTLLASADGGRNWHAVPAPCAGQWGAPRAVSLASPEVGWVLCTGQPSAGQQSKAVYATSDGGRTWSAAGDLGGGGYAAGLFFRADGHGWLWEARGGAVATADGGRTWHPLAVAQPEVVEASSLWFPTDTVGFAVLRDNDRRTWGLMRSGDGGAHWTMVQSWSID